MLYSVVVPVYNSVETLAELFNRVREVFEKASLEYEIIFIDDFSEDSSWSVIRTFKKENPNIVKIVRFARNYGQHNATFCGLQYSNGDYMITIDDDLQNAPEDILKLIEESSNNECDIVYGVGPKQHPFWRKWGSNLLRAGNKRLEKGPSEGSSFRCMTRRLVNNVITHDKQFIFLDEVLFWYTNKIAFQTVQHFKRPKGKSGYSLRKLIKLVTQSTLFYSTWPLKLMTIGGLLLSFLSFLLGINFIVLKLIYDVPVQGFTALIVTILFSTSLVLLCFGILGSYIKHIFTVLNNKPMFSIAEEQL